jgi:flavin reductase (DIM6/NTAB) family NADH-FMN oxidoreductase RutF/DNA-binding MarR family transcriptional regulator
MNDAQVLETKNLRTTFGQFPSGVAIVTCQEGSSFNGMTISSFSSVSISPALVSWSIRKESSKLQQFTEAQNFAFSILRNDQINAAKAFAKGDPQAFKENAYVCGENGAPLIESAIAHIECQHFANYDGGDHIIILGKITRHQRFDGKPLVFSQGQFCESQEINLASVAEKAACDTSSKDEYMHLLPLLRAAEGHISNLLTTHRKALNLNPISARILTLLSNGEKNKEKLDEAISADPASIQDQLNELVNAQLIHNSNGVYSITHQGVERRVSLLENAEKIYAIELQKFSSTEIENFKKILTYLAREAQ